jgi:bacterioferritin-associated ferredoxin
VQARCTRRQERARPKAPAQHMYCPRVSGYSSRCAGHTCRCSSSRAFLRQRDVRHTSSARAPFAPSSCAPFCKSASMAPCASCVVMHAASRGVAEATPIGSQCGAARTCMRSVADAMRLCTVSAASRGMSASMRSAARCSAVAPCRLARLHAMQQVVVLLKPRAGSRASRWDCAARRQRGREGGALVRASRDEGHKQLLCLDAAVHAEQRDEQQRCCAVQPV